MTMRQVINTQSSEEVITLEEIDQNANKENGAYLSISKTNDLSILCYAIDRYTWAGVSGNLLFLSRDHYFSLMSLAIKNKLGSGATVYRFDSMLELFSYILINW